MDICGLYNSIDGDYEELIGRLGSEKIVEKLLRLFLEDGNFQKLNTSMCYGNYEDAFRAVHGLKGICANLAITKLWKLTSDMTECLRNSANIEGADEIFPKLCDEYGRVADEIKNALD